VSAPSKPESPGRSSRLGRLRRDSRGAVFVEFLIAFLPVYVFFLCVVQLGLLFVVRLIVEHAAVNGARALAVVAGDDPKTYGGFEKELNRVNRNGRREEAVRNAVVLSLAPLILNGVVQKVDVIVPRADQPDGAKQTGDLRFAPMGEKTVTKVRLRVEVDAACRLALAGPIACNNFTDYLDPLQKLNLRLPTQKVRAEAIFPYQGARYEYPP
jgi:Flp pilus assembly protein TadG